MLICVVINIMSPAVERSPSAALLAGGKSLLSKTLGGSRFFWVKQAEHRVIFLSSSCWMCLTLQCVRSCLLLVITAQLLTFFEWHSRELTKYFVWLFPHKCDQLENWDIHTTAAFGKNENVEGYTITLTYVHCRLSGGCTALAVKSHFFLVQSGCI